MKPLLLTLLMSLIGRELWGWIPMLTRCVLWFITLPLTAEHRARRREEWQRHLEDEFEEQRIAGLLWAVSLSRVCALEVGRRLRERIAFEPAIFRNLPPSEQTYWRALASSMILMACAAGLAGAVAASSTFGIRPLVASLVGLGWGACVLWIERLIVALPPEAGGPSGGAGLWRRTALTFLSAMPRILLSVVLGFATVEPLMLRVFNREIAAQAGGKHSLSLFDQFQALSALAAAHPSVSIMENTMIVLFVLLFTMPLAIRVYLRLIRPSSYAFYL